MILGTLFVMIQCGTVYYRKYRRAQGIGGQFLDMSGCKTKETKTDRNKQKAKKKDLSHDLFQYTVVFENAFMKLCNSMLTVNF